MDIELTKSAQKSLAILYEEYKKRIKNGESKEEASYFCAPFQKDVYQKIRNDEKELIAAGLVEARIRAVILLPNAFSYIETMKKEKTKKRLLNTVHFIRDVVKPFLM